MHQRHFSDISSIVIWCLGCFGYASCKVKVPFYGISSQDSRVPSGFLHGARHPNGCPRNDAATRKSLFANELLRLDAKRKISAKRNYHGQHGNGLVITFGMVITKSKYTDGIVLQEQRIFVLGGGLLPQELSYAYWSI
jgi:hypothetical protein